LAITMPRANGMCKSHAQTGVAGMGQLLAIWVLPGAVQSGSGNFGR
jgi:hypothetical protein